MILGMCRYLRRWLVVSSVLAVAASSALSASSALTASSALQAAEPACNGWPVVDMSDDLVRVAVAPSVGGRVVSYRVAEHEFIFTEPSLAGQIKGIDAKDPQFWAGGARTWLAPQERWTRDGQGWPPAPSLDYGPWIVTGTATSITATSPIEADARWNCVGMRINRTVTRHPGSTRLTVEHQITNAGTQHQAWAAWSNVQIAATPGAAWVWLPVRQDGQYAPHGIMWYGKPGAAAEQARICPTAGIAAVQYLHREGKMGADTPVGWVCSVEDGWAFARSFVITPGERRTENGNTVAVYTCGSQQLMEIETMGPLKELVPGAQFTFTEEWAACRIPPGPVTAVTAGGVIVAPLTATNWNGEIFGTFGVFERGTANLCIGSTIVWSGPVDPREPLTIFVTTTFPSAGGEAVLSITTREGERELTRCAITGDPSKR